MEPVKGGVTIQSGETYQTFVRCGELRELGFPQARKYGAMYYVRPDMLINIADLSVLKSDGDTDFENIFSTLVFKPRFEDLHKECEPFFQELIKISDGTYFAYSTVEEDPEYIKQTGRQDKYIRARGDTPWHALVNLYITVQSAIRKQDGEPRTLPPEVLESSENAEKNLYTESPPENNG